MPIFAELNYNTFKMVFDLGDIVSIKQGDRLFRQDAKISDFYIIMHGQIGLKYKGAYDLVEHNPKGGFHGLTLGEEILFYEKPLYRETAVCMSPHCCVLVLAAETFLQLGDDQFESKGIQGEMFRKDMEVMFEHVTHIYN